jgi:hypothetical protein
MNFNIDVSVESVSEYSVFSGETAESTSNENGSETDSIAK